MKAMVLKEMKNFFSLRFKNTITTTLIYGTGNPAKLKTMRENLASLPIQIIGLNQTGKKIPDINESGNTPLENARLKALSYYKILNCPVFACDSGLYIEGLPDEKQPSVHVRMIDGKRLNDNEMIEHYSTIARNMGGKSVARYKNAICLVISEEEIYQHFGDDISGNPFYLVDKPHPKRVEGFPLDCISVHIESGKYYYDYNPIGVVNEMEEGFCRFFRNSLKLKG